MFPHRFASMLGLALLAAACSGDGGADPNAPRATFKVLTRNLYLGSELFDGSLPSSVQEIPARAATLWETAMGSDFPARAELLAEEILTHKPDLVALQEVEIYRTQTPSDVSPDRPEPNATAEAIEFLKVLQAALAKRGLTYRAHENTLTDTELPAGRDPSMLMDVRLTDRDVILVRDGVASSNLVAKRFATHIPIELGASQGVKGIPLKVYRGYMTVEVVLDGARFSFVNSHLEVGGGGVGGNLLKAFQESQAMELMRAVDALKGTLVVAGDFNSPATGTGTTSYMQLTAKLTDSWPKVRGAEPGLTCCSSLKGDTFTAGTRIDLVLTRGSARAEAAEVIGTTAKTPGGLFASDHAGVVVTLSVPKAN